LTCKPRAKADISKNQCAMLEPGSPTRQWRPLDRQILPTLTSYRRRSGYGSMNANG
jgi:hypothetical protein